MGCPVNDSPCLSYQVKGYGAGCGSSLVGSRIGFYGILGYSGYVAGNHSSSTLKAAGFCKHFCASSPGIASIEGKS